MRATDFLHTTHAWVLLRWVPLLTALGGAACNASIPDTGAAGSGGEGGGDVSTIPPDCTLQGDLTLELGEGDIAFTPLGEGAGPELHYGPQGGTHLLLAVRVTTPNPIDKYKVKVLAEVGQPDCTAQPCDMYTKAGSIETVVVGNKRVIVDVVHSDVLGLFVIVDGWLSGTQRRISVAVNDECDRQGALVYEFTGGS
ncbi:MAG: hypothetical protein IPK82_40495 [Polyangiaceae bacterium]|nr:hypothetical protein [Polyangiaceae bacterium]